MIGIYKIESPSKSVYIGQSRDIKKRFKLYDCKNNKKVKQPLIERSINKHGYENHKFSILIELPVDVSSEVLTRYEQIYMDQYRECGFAMLNILAAKGSPYGFKRPIEQRERHSKMMKGRTSPMKGKKHTEETKQIIRDKRALQNNLPSRPKGSIPWNKGLKMPPGFYPPRVTSEETKEKLRQISTGKKLSPESIAKRTKTLQENLKIKPKKDWSEDAKKRQSERLKQYFRNKN